MQDQFLLQEIETPRGFVRGRRGDEQATGKSGIQNFGKVQHGVEQLHLRERIGSMGYILHDRHAFPEKIGETLRARGAGGNSTNLEGDADQIEARAQLADN